MRRYFIGVIAIILLLVLAVVFVFNRGDNPPATTQQPAQLIDYADENSAVTLTTVGRVVGDDEHRSVRVTVSANERRIEILSGYNQNVISSQSYANTQAAYETFLSALGGQGFIRSKETNVTDSRSVCPTGVHYEYRVTVGSEQKSNLWAVSCDRTGTFNGRGSTIRQLFQRQIPDYSQQTQGIIL